MKKLRVFNPDGSLKEEVEVVSIRPADGPLVGWFLLILGNGMTVYLTMQQLNDNFGTEWWALFRARAE